MSLRWRNLRPTRRGPLMCYFRNKPRGKMPELAWQTITGIKTTFLKASELKILVYIVHKM